MTSSESPTHPDAPRAGGETPDLDVAATRRLLAKIERDYRDSAYACDASSFGSLGATRRRIADDVAQLRAALPALLARHRDGERLDWLEHCNSQKRGEVPILPPSCGYSVRQYIDAQLADANTPCAAGPSPERASK